MKWIAVVLFLALSFSTFTNSQISAAGVLSVYFFDAGGNSGYDAVLMQTPDGTNVVIGSGTNLESNEFTRFLAEKGVGRIHYLIAPNASASYVGMHDTLIWQFGSHVEKILDVGQPNSNTQYVDFIETACAHEIDINTPRDGDVFNWGSVTATFLSPSEDQLRFVSSGKICSEDYFAGADEFEALSLVFKVEFGSTSLLFTGNIGDGELEDLLDRHSGELVSTLVKLPRHGDEVGFSQLAFIEETSPQIAVAMASSLDHFGRPCDSLLNELSIFGISTYVTGIHGTVSFLSDGTTEIIETERDITNNPLELQSRNSSAESC